VCVSSNYYQNKITRTQLLSLFQALLERKTLQQVSLIEASYWLMPSHRPLTKMSSKQNSRPSSFLHCVPWHIDFLLLALFSPTLHPFSSFLCLEINLGYVRFSMRYSSSFLRDFISLKQTSFSWSNEIILEIGLQTWCDWTSALVL